MLTALCFFGIALAFAALLFAFRFWSVRRMFKRGNVSVCGLRGRGKDMLMANVACRSKGYVSNIDYGGNYIPLNFSDLMLGGNDFRNLISGKVNAYTWPYNDGVDIYISDAGCYLPAQYNGELNRDLKPFPMVMALSRHLGLANVHYNSQALNRVWDKVREQSDTYIRCLRCRVFGRLVVQRIRIYEQYEAACNNVPLFPIKRPLLNADRKQRWDLQYANYLIQHGGIREMMLIYVNKSTYDTRRFKTIMEGSYD